MYSYLQVLRQGNQQNRPLSFENMLLSYLTVLLGTKGERAELDLASRNEWPHVTTSIAKGTGTWFLMSVRSSGVLSATFLCVTRS